MPYKNYMTEEEFHNNCIYWGAVENELSCRYNPNPWLFKSGHLLCPQSKRYAFTYRNFDDSEHLFCFVEEIASAKSVCVRPSSSRLAFILSPFVMVGASLSVVT